LIPDSTDTETLTSANRAESKSIKEPLRALLEVDQTISSSMNLPRSIANNWLDMDTELRALAMTLEGLSPLKTASFVYCLQAIRGQCLERERRYKAYAGEVRNAFLSLT
jgi:hypothetical protein